MGRITKWLKRVGGFVVSEREAKGDDKKTVNTLPEKKLIEAGYDDRMKSLGARNGVQYGSGDEFLRTFSASKNQREEKGIDDAVQAGSQSGMSGASRNHNPRGDRKDEMIGLGEQAPPFPWLVFFREAEGQPWRIVARSPGRS